MTSTLLFNAMYSCLFDYFTVFLSGLTLQKTKPHKKTPEKQTPHNKKPAAPINQGLLVI